MYRSVNSYYKWTLKVPFSGQLYIGLQTRVVAYMNHNGLASSEGQQYSGWIKHEVYTTQSLIIIHCRAIGESTDAKTPTVIMAALDAAHSRNKVIEHNKNDTQEQHTSASFLASMHMSVYIYIWAI